MGGCYTCMKYLYIVLNLLFMIFGITGIGFTAWMLNDQTIPLRFTQQPNDFVISVSIYLVVSIVLFILSIMGIYSVCKEVRWALVMSFSLLLIVVVVEVASGVWGYMNKDDLMTFTRASVKKTVQEDYRIDNDIKEMFDTVQSKMHCCGAENPRDWIIYRKLDLGVQSKQTVFNIPRSCCREGISENDCTSASSDIKVGANPDFDKIYDKGCYNLILDKLSENLCVILSVCGAILAVQLVGLILGLILAFSMNKFNRYKA